MIVLKMGRKRVLLRDVGIWCALVLLTLPHLNPRYFDQLPKVELILNAWRLASFLVIILVTAIKRRLSLIVLLISLQQLYLMAITFLNRGNVFSAATSAFSILSIAMLYNYAYKKGNIFLSSQLFCFELAIYINLLTEIIYPEGMWYTNASTSLFSHGKNWFLGYYNNHSQFFIPALLIAMLYKEHTRKKLRTYTLISATWLSAIIAKSGGYSFRLQ